MGHAREGIGQRDVQHLGEQLADHAFHERHDAFLVQEGGLDVDLGELGLAVGAQILVAEAAHDLVVAIDAAHHQQLLEELRRLRQRKELTRMGTAGHQVIARTFRRGAGQHGCFHVHETVAIQVVAQKAGDARAQLEMLQHGGAAQVDVAITQAHVLADLVLVELERRSLGGIEDVQRRRHYLDGARRQTRVFGASRPAPYPAANAQHVFTAHRFGGRKHLGIVRMADDLGQAFPIAQVDEDHPAMIAPPVHPAGQFHVLVDEIGVQGSTVMTTHVDYPSGKAAKAGSEKAARANPDPDPRAPAGGGMLGKQPEPGKGCFSRLRHSWCCSRCCFRCRWRMKRILRRKPHWRNSMTRRRCACCRS